MQQDLKSQSILLAPIQALFSPSFYRRVLISSPGKGFLYLLYLSLLAAILGTTFFSFSLLPRAERFTEWLKDMNFPEIRFTPEGSSSDVAQPYTLVHPKLGTLLVLDTTKNSLDMAALPQAWVYIIKTKAVIQGQQAGERRIVDLAPPASDRTPPKSFTLTGQLIQDAFHRAIPALYAGFFIFVFLLYFFLKLAGALLGSLIALVLNLFRKNKLDYGRLLNCTMFAMTAASILQAISLLPLPFKMSVNPIVSAVITGTYLGFILLVLKEEHGSESGESLDFKSRS